jgi:two-component sensor histidine kinase
VSAPRVAYSIWFCCILLCCTLKLCNAQTQPAISIIDKSRGLQSNTIYNIHTAKNGLLYLAHTKGISSFDGSVVKHYYNKDYPYTELTNIMEASDGTIFAKAFNGAVYQIVGDSTRHMKQHQPATTFSSSTIFNSEIFSLVNDDVQAVDIKSNQVKTYNISALPMGTSFAPLVFCAMYFGGNQPYLICVDKRRKIYKVAIPADKAGKFHFNNGQVFSVVDRSLEKVYYLNTDIKLPIKSQQGGVAVNYVSVVDSTIWICTTNGIYYYKEAAGPSAMQHILPGYNATDIDKTFEHNYIVSTLDKGLLLIPSFKVSYLENAPQNITTIASSVNGILVGTAKGAITNYTSTAHQQVKQDANLQPIKYLLQDANSSNLVYSNAKGFFYDNGYQPKLIKDHTYVGSDLLIGTNGGMDLLFADKPKSWLKNFVDASSSNKCSNLATLTIGIGEVVSTIKYDAKHDKIYYNTYAGIFEIANGDAQPKKLPEPGCVLKDMACCDGSLYLASKDQGLLVWDGTRYKPITKNNPSSDVLLKLEVYKDELWILGEHAIYCKKGDSVLVYDIRHGVNVEDALNFCVKENEVYVNNGANVLMFPKSIAYAAIAKPKFTITEIRNEASNTLINQRAELSYSDNNVLINYSLIAYANSKGTHVAYTINNGKLYHLENSTRTLELKNLTPDEYFIKFFLVENGAVATNALGTVAFSIKPPFYKTVLFTVAMVALAILLTWLIARYIVNNIRKEAQQKQAQMLLEKELDKSMLASIKAQMNPHFLFNALNTIQSYIYSLTRSILEMSNKETITLAEEIESLKLYLELEKMRFEDSLTYEFIVDDKLRKDLITLPSMLLQPYVENALKHGLLHKKTNRQLTIRFSHVNNMLEVEIDDNGVGRKRSAELNAIKNRSHKSFALDANQKRLEILRQHYKDINLEIIDKHSDLGEAIGTKVIVRLGLQVVA